MRRLFRDAYRVATTWPLFFWSVVAILALGVGANAAVFAAVRELLIEPPPYRDPDSIVLFRRIDHFARVPLTASDIPELEQLRGFATVAGCSASAFPMWRNRPAVLAAPIEVTEGFFELFGVRPLQGRVLAAGDFGGGQRPAVLSYELWQSMFGGDPGVAGRAITLGHSQWTVVGVMPRSFQPRCFEIDGPVAWVPHGAAADLATEPDLMVMARLAPGFSLVQAQAEFDGLAQHWKSHRADDRLAGHLLEPVHASRAAAARPGLLLLQSVAGLLLLVACTNIAGTLLLHVSERRSELALRVTLGATPWQILRQMLGEMGAVAVLGGVLGGLLAVAVTASLGSLAAPVLAGVSIEMSWPDLLGALALGAGALVVFGTVPACVAAFASGKVGIAGHHPATHRVRATLLILQVSVTILLLTGATMLLRSYRHAMSTPSGFQSDGLLTTDVHLPVGPGRPSSFFSAFQAAVTSLNHALAETASVEGLAFSDASPFSGGGSNVRVDVFSPGVPEAVKRSFRMCHVSANYFSVLQIPVVRGQSFSGAVADVTDVVVSEAFARMLRQDAQRPVSQEDEVLGTIVRTPANVLRIVGVVGDVKSIWLTTDASPVLYAPIALADASTISITALSRRPAEAVADMRQAIARAQPAAPAVAIESLGTIVWRSEVRRRFYLAIAGTFTLVAILVSALGIFSAVGRVVSFRSREIAIRVALGAQPAEIGRRVLLEGLFPVIVGTAAGLLGGLALVRLSASLPFVQSLLFKVAADDLLTYAVAVAVVLMNAALACALPLTRALRLDPVTALKSE